MNKTLLAQDLLLWEQKRRDLDLLEAAIHDAVLQAQESFEVGYVRAVYHPARQKPDYKRAVLNWYKDWRALLDEPDLPCHHRAARAAMQKATSLVYLHTTDHHGTYWREVCAELEISSSDIPIISLEPSVTLHLTGDPPPIENFPF